MDEARHFTVIDRNGEQGRTRTPPARLESGVPVVVELGGDRAVEVPAAALLEHEAGSSYLLRGDFADFAERRRTDFREDGATPSRGEPVVVPVVEEEVSLDRRWVETGRVRVSKRVNERVEVVDEPLLLEEVHVERVPVDRVVDGPVPVRYEGDTMIVPLFEEVLVVEKRLVLKEELRITKRRREERSPQEVTLRSEEARVERLGPREP
jgi:uncharacterized protein (TIGR02271 family)